LRRHYQASQNKGKKLPKYSRRRQVILSAFSIAVKELDMGSHGWVWGCIYNFTKQKDL
jgi:hypothetical protein